MVGVKEKINAGWGSGEIVLKALQGGLFFLALLLVLMVILVPLSPIMPGEGLDPSWMYGLNEAVAQGRSFGREIVFTFGPYASIYTKTYHPATDKLMVWGGFYLALSFSIVLYANFRLAGWPLRFVVLFILSALMINHDALLFFYPLLVGVQVYRDGNAVNLNIPENVSGAIFKAVLFFPFGLLALVKGSALVGCVVISTFSIVLLVRRSQWKVGVLVGVAPLLSLVFFWVLSGQSIFGLPDYFQKMVPIIVGYSDAMATYGDQKECMIYALAGFLMLVLLFFGVQSSGFEKCIVTLMFLFILFLAFKAGFVRHDDHAVISGTTILLGGVLAGTLLSARSSFVLFFACSIAWGYICAAHVSTSIDVFKKSITSTYVGAWNGLTQRIRDPEALARTFGARVTELDERGGIPNLGGSVDIYSYDQSYLIASKNKWNPRPVFQSYSVYTAELAQINKDHLVSVNRPDNVVFRVQPIDGRLPSLEDGASWPVLFSNYEPVSFLGGSLFLKSRGNSSHVYEEPRKIGGGFYSFGDVVDFPKSGGPLYVKLKTRKSFLGRLFDAFFKPSALFAKITLQNGATRNYRMIAGMSEAGFVASPLIESTVELGALFAGRNYVSDKEVKSIEIVASGFPFLWERVFQIDFYEAKLKESPDFFGRMELVRPQSGVNGKASLLELCEGSIDYANGFSVGTELVRAASLLTVRGWLAASVARAEVPDKVHLVLSDARGGRYVIDARHTQRLDVGAHFNKPELNSSGFETTADVSELVGQYRLGLAYSKGNEVFLCPQFDLPVRISRE